MSADVRRFRGAILERLGLSFDEVRTSLLAEVLERRATAKRVAVDVYLDRFVDDPAARDEWEIIARELTVSETYFFRHGEQLRAFEDVVLSRTTHPRVISAGCATGEEPYSLAILVKERGLDASIRAIDLNRSSIERAQRGRYSAWSLRETPDAIKRRWFEERDREFVLAPAIRGMVTFQQRNLALDEADLWLPETYDVVFCRNVIMYFAPAVARRIVSGIARALAPGGHLFLGHAETLRGLSHDFHLCHTHETFYYRRKDTLDAHASYAFDVPVALAPMPGVAAADGWADSWLENVRRSTEKIRALTEPRPLAATSPLPEGDLVLDAAKDLLKKERFADALALVAGTDASRPDPETLLLRAVLLMHNGELAASEVVCRDLIALDELNVGARYVLALCREGAADLDGAREHDQIAVYVDPSFAMPRLHLGLLARRAGERDVARRELGQALSLLESEDASRLLLFGGGFGREGLVALCRAELDRLGDRR